MEKTAKPSYVYFIESTSGHTYIGSTIDLNHRLRQHNREITGGAKRTSIQVAKGEKWSRICHVEGFPTWISALQFEWRWKQITRLRTKGGTARQRRFKALALLLSMDKATEAAIPYSAWSDKPRIVFTQPDDETLYDRTL